MKNRCSRHSHCIPQMFHTSYGGLFRTSFATLPNTIETMTDRILFHIHIAGRGGRAPLEYIVPRRTETIPLSPSCTAIMPFFLHSNPFSFLCSPVPCSPLRAPESVYITTIVPYKKNHPHSLLHPQSSLTLATLSQKISKTGERLCEETTIETERSAMEGSTNSPVAPVSPNYEETLNTSIALTIAPKEIDQEAINHIVRGYRQRRYLDELVQEIVEQGYRPFTYRELVRGFFLEGLELSVDNVRNESEKPALAEAIETAVSADLKRRYPLTPAATPTAGPKDVDRHAITRLIGGYESGEYIDVLVQELVDQGYKRLNYHEIAFQFLLFGLELSEDQVLDEIHKPVVAQAAQAAGPPAKKREVAPPVGVGPSEIRFTVTDEEGKKTVIEDPARKEELFHEIFGDNSGAESGTSHEEA